MTKFNFMAVAVLTATIGFSLTSCHNSNEPQSIPDSKEKAIELYVAGVNTRATSGNLNSGTIHSTIKVGVFGVPEGGELIGKNKEYTVEPEGKLSATEDMIAKVNMKLDILAYAPYNSDWESHSASQTFTVKEDQTLDANYLASDLLYAKETINSVTADHLAVGLTFDHKMARIELTVKNNKQNEELKNVTVKINNTILSASFTPSSGKVSVVQGEVKDIIAHEFSEDVNNLTAYAIIVPQTVESGKTLFTIETEEKIFTAKLSSEVNFVGGQSYAYTININEKDVTITLDSAPSVKDWNSGTDVTGSFDAEENEKK